MNISMLWPLGITTEMHFMIFFPNFLIHFHCHGTALNDLYTQLSEFSTGLFEGEVV